jgi:hypothetical protein
MKELMLTPQVAFSFTSAFPFLITGSRSRSVLITRRLQLVVLVRT